MRTRLHTMCDVPAQTEHSGSGGPLVLVGPHFCPPLSLLHCVTSPPLPPRNVVDLSFQKQTVIWFLDRQAQLISFTREMLHPGSSAVTAEVLMLCGLRGNPGSWAALLLQFRASGLGHTPMPSWVTLWVLFRAQPYFPYETGENTAYLIKLCED